MASTLYDHGTATTQAVDVTDEDARDIGDVDVKSVAGTVDVSSRAGRDIGRVDIANQPNVDIGAQSLAALDVSAATVPVEQQTSVAVDTLPDADSAVENGTALASGGTLPNALTAAGADTLRGRVVRATTSYDVTVDWEDGAGNVLFSDTIASAVAAGTETAINEPAISPYCTVTVADAGAGSGAVTATLHFR